MAAKTTAPSRNGATVTRSPAFHVLAVWWDLVDGLDLWKL